MPTSDAPKPPKIHKTAAEWKKMLPGLTLEMAKELEANPPHLRPASQEDLPPAPHVYRGPRGRVSSDEDEIPWTP